VVSQKRVPVNKVIYEFPSGMVELNESLVESAERELIEETGYKNQSKMKLISSFFCEPGRLTTKITGYYSDSLIKLQKPEDEIKIHFLTKSEIFKLIENKKFIHASHISMFFLFLKKFD
jgi:ADP-ribose pyrophosphatase